MVLRTPTTTSTSATGSLRFQTNGNNERMRIDSSGRLLINKTSAGLSTPGIEFDGSNDRAQFTRSGTPINVNRLSSDGSIINFYKDSTFVGSVGVDNSDNITISGNSSHAGFEFGSSSIVAYKNGTSPDNTISLGGGAQRFANLYLGGGLYVGGTGSANKLDDYEEGTFTPEITSASGSVTHSTQTGNYTKVGRLVYFDIRVVLSAISSPSGTLKIEGLPFTGGVSGRTGVTNYSIVNNAGSLNQTNIMGSYIANSSVINVSSNDGTNSNASQLTATTQFDVSGIYQSN